MTRWTAVEGATLNELEMYPRISRSYDARKCGVLLPIEFRGFQAQSVQGLLLVPLFLLSYRSCLRRLAVQSDTYSHPETVEFKRFQVYLRSRDLRFSLLC